MYSMEQRREHTAELQRLLYEIAVHTGRIPMIIPDGIYGAETEEAVREFCREYGVPEGVMDSAEIWDRIAEVNRSFHVKAQRPDIFPEGTVIRTGSRGAEVWMLQYMLSELGRRYKAERVPEVSGICGADTIETAEEFGRISGVGLDDGGVGVGLWNAITVCFNSNAVWHET